MKIKGFDKPIATYYVPSKRGLGRYMVKLYENQKDTCTCQATRGKCSHRAIARLDYDNTIQSRKTNTPLSENQPALQD